MTAKPMGMLWMMPPRWLDDPTGATWQVLEAPSEGRLMGWTNKFTLLDNIVRGIGGAAARGWVGETGRRQRLAGVHVPDRDLRFWALSGP